jgi:uncharacterized protein YaiL (DUF2058 family)
MKNALQEQLLKAGLATEDQLAKAKRGQRRPPGNKGRKGGRPKRPRDAANSKPRHDDSDLARAWAARQQAEREEAARKKQLKAQRKANRAKIRQLLLDNCLNSDTADIPFQFMVGTNIKNIYVTEEQRKQLLAGALRITFQDGRRCLIPADVATRIHELDPEKLIINPAEVEETIDDDYADFQVPDDLIW